MSAAEPDHLDELAALALELATGAAAVVRDHADAARSIGSKSSVTDLVTDADRLTERWLREQLAVRRPGDAVLGEEEGAAAGQTGPHGVRWVLDPIDGTVNFVLGLPQYAVSVAAELDGQAVAGAVCNPVTGEVFHARRGGGAFLGELRLSGPRSVPLERMVIGTGFGYDADRRARQGAVVARLLPRIADIRRLGAASLDLCAVAAGRLDGYFEIGLQRWDYAAGLVIATEAGCVASGPAGAPPSSQLLVISGADNAAALAALLEDCGIGDVLA